MEILELNKTKGTFFILGWIAEHHPVLIKSIHKEGHEIACHGYGHELVSKLTPEKLEMLTKLRIYWKI